MKTIPLLETDEIRLPWIQAGYAVFAQKGPAGLKVESLARKVGKSKSSFYHHFADLEVFTEQLLACHRVRSRWIAEQERACRQLVPDLLLLIVTIKEDLLFNRQLRIHRQVPAFRACFEQVSAEVGDAMLGIWAEALGLSDRTHLAQVVLNLVIENFYLQITEETLTYPWLEAYVAQIQHAVQGIQLPRG
ncbi:MAG: TetR/AcrR family transcriptional regulator [Bacteroidia bacterium]|nr:TetR/AcrR family transcriptional regulator [Bacteroidia bacterium]